MKSSYQPYQSFDEWSLREAKKSPKFMNQAMEVLKRLQEHSKKNPGKKFKAHTIAKATGYKQVNSIMRWLRLQGYPICSDSKGYWYSDHPSDIQFTINQLQDRVYAMQHAIDKLWKHKGG